MADHWRKSPMFGNRNNGQFRIIFFQNDANPPFFAIGTVPAVHKTTPTGRDTDNKFHGARQ
jgi:hypothetical protein